MKNSWCGQILLFENRIFAQWKIPDAGRFCCLNHGRTKQRKCSFHNTRQLAIWTGLIVFFSVKTPPNSTTRSHNRNYVSNSSATLDGRTHPRTTTDHQQLNLRTSAGPLRLSTEGFGQRICQVQDPLEKMHFLEFPQRWHWIMKRTSNVTFNTKSSSKELDTSFLGRSQSFLQTQRFQTEQLVTIIIFRTLFSSFSRVRQDFLPSSSVQMQFTNSIPFVLKKKKYPKRRSGLQKDHVGKYGIGTMRMSERNSAEIRSTANAQDWIKLSASTSSISLSKTGGEEMSFDCLPFFGLLVYVPIPFSSLTPSTIFLYSIMIFSTESFTRKISSKIKPSELLFEKWTASWFYLFRVCLDLLMPSVSFSSVSLASLNNFGLSFSKLSYSSWNKTNDNLLEAYLRSAQSALSRPNKENVCATVLLKTTLLLANKTSMCALVLAIRTQQKWIIASQTSALSQRQGRALEVVVGVRGQVGGGGSPRQRHVHDSIRPSLLTAALAQMLLPSSDLCRLQTMQTGNNAAASPPAAWCCCRQFRAQLFVSTLFPFFRHPANCEVNRRSVNRILLFSSVKWENLFIFQLLAITPSLTCFTMFLMSLFAAWRSSGFLLFNNRARSWNRKLNLRIAQFLS